MSALNLSDGAGVSSPGGKDLWPSTRFTQETEGKKILGLAYGGERLEQFLYRNVLIAVTVMGESKMWVPTSHWGMGALTLYCMHFGVSSRRCIQRAVTTLY